MSGEEWGRLVAGICFILFLCLITMLALSLWGCGPSKPATYEGALILCNKTAHTFKESVDCENAVRAEYGRPLRDAGGDQ